MRGEYPGYRVSGAGEWQSYAWGISRVSGVGCRGVAILCVRNIPGIGYRVSGVGCRGVAILCVGNIPGIGYRVSGVGCRGVAILCVGNVGNILQIQSIHANSPLANACASDHKGRPTIIFTAECGRISSKSSPSMPIARLRTLARATTRVAPPLYSPPNAEEYPPNPVHPCQ